MLHPALVKTGTICRPHGAATEALTALGIGLIVAVVVCYTGPWLAAIVGAIGGFVTTLAVQAGLWLRKALAINAEQAA